MGAALLTGRNHHTAASGVIGEQATGFPGYTGIIPKSCATIAEILSQNGYATGSWGKNHNVPDNTTSPAGPFDNWPTRMACVMATPTRSTTSSGTSSWSASSTGSRR